jgi:hypothetical protein
LLQFVDELFADGAAPRRAAAAQSFSGSAQSTAGSTICRGRPFTSTRRVQGGVTP